MGSALSRMLDAGVAIALLIVVSPGIGDAQPAREPSAPVNAETRAAARKLVNEGIAAQDAKEYDRAIALYLRAFSLDPHPLLLFNVGQAHRLAGCPRRAVPFYERYLTLEPKGTQATVARDLLAEIKRSSRPDGPGCAKASAADELVDGAPAVTPMGRLKLRSTPFSVSVMLDGEKIGTTPIDREVSAGAHSITLVDGSRLVGERKVEIEAGAVVEVTMPVEDPPKDDGPMQPARPSRVVPVLLWAGGAGAIVGGSVALYYGGKGGPDEKYVYPGATPAGVALVSAGAVAIGVGVWLWVRGSRESAPIASVGPGVGYLGWQGRF